jgi:PBP1b-binding outer membrane lipoprotein LpoB
MTYGQIGMLGVLAVALAGCNMRQDMAGPNSSETRQEVANMAEPVDTTPLSSTPGAAPDNSQVEPRDPVTLPQAD